jgi:predicted amidophosphoribosyltransferase
MSDNHPRMARESDTIEVMINLYCRGQHEYKDELCVECRELLEYARERLDKCPFQENKTTCAKCPVHCYRPAMREKIRIVMRYAGPRMVYRHPILALFHFIDGVRKEPVRPRREVGDS